MRDIRKNKIIKKYRNQLVFLIDISIVSFSFLLTTFGRFDFNISSLIKYGFQMNLYKAVSVIIIYSICFKLFKVQKSLWKYIGISETKNISSSVILASSLLLGYCFIFNNQGMLINIIVVSGMLTILLMFSIRVSYRMLFYSSSDMKQLSNSIIIGAGNAGYMILKELEQNKNSLIKIVGFVDDNKSGMIVSGKDVLGSINDLPQLIDKYKIDVVYFAIPSASMGERKKILSSIENCNVKIKIMKTSERVLSSNDSFENKYPIEDISIEDLLGRGEITLEQSEISSYIEGKVICVTGAGGSIGSELCRQIVKFNPIELIMIDINENGIYMLEQEFSRKKNNHILSDSIRITSLVASIRDESSLSEIFEEFKPTTVFHAAAHKHVPLMETRPIEAIKNNIFGTNNVIKCCISKKVERFIMISTDKAVNPTNVMGASKRMTEMIVEANRENGITKLATVRFGNVLGSNGSVIPIFKEQIKNGGPVTITNKNITRYFMTIPEAAQLVLQAGFYASKGEIFVLDMGQPIKILDLAERMIRLAGYKPYNEIDILEIGLRKGEKMYEELHLENETVTKTKNNLIFVTKPIDISMTFISKKLQELEMLVANNTSEIEIKEVLFKSINEKEIQI